MSKRNSAIPVIRHSSGKVCLLFRNLGVNVIILIKVNESEVRLGAA
jgi:hypothetical protein